MNHVSYKAVPMYSFNTNPAISSNAFVARPIKSWRKQLQSATIAGAGAGTGTGLIRSTSKASIGMPMDRPGSTVDTTDACITCDATVPLQDVIIKDSPCKSCDPIGANTQTTDRHYISNKAYMQSRCVTYDQRMAYNPAAFVTYFSSSGVPLEPSAAADGPQVRETNSCYTPMSPSPSPCFTTIYKPNNAQFAQQGGVSSGSRISRLRYNTLNNNTHSTNGAPFNSAAGAVGINTGLYQLQPSPSYYTKPKPQPSVCNPIMGTSVYCS